MDKDFTNEFYRMWNLISTKKSMAYSRYADGEVSLMRNKIVGNNTQAYKMDKWSYTDNSELSLIGKDLIDTLNHIEDEYYYAISCQCCDPDSKKWLLERIKHKPENITYSNLWINDNYRRFIQKVADINEPVYLICNKVGITGMYPFDVCGFYGVEDNCVELWKNKKNELLQDMKKLASSNNEMLFFISAGPLSELFVHYMWETNKNNRYIDVGSAIDEFIKLEKTREFMVETSQYYMKKCIF